MNCEGCVYYRYEPDTNFKYCTNSDQENTEEGASINGYEECHMYYSVEDAKADSKYEHCDRY